MLYEKEVKEAFEDKKEYMKAQIIEKVEALAIARRTAHEVGWKYEEIDRWIAGEAPEQFARFEAMSDGNFGEYLFKKLMAELIDRAKEIEED